MIHGFIKVFWRKMPLIGIYFFYYAIFTPYVLCYRIIWRNRLYFETKFDKNAGSYWADCQIQAKCFTFIEEDEIQKKGIHVLLRWVLLGKKYYLFLPILALYYLCKPVSVKEESFSSPHTFIYPIF